MTDEEDIVDRLRAPMNILMADDLTYEAAEEIERLRKERDEARQRLCDIVVLVEAEQDQRTSKKHGHDISMLTSVKVVTTFLMTPEFVEDLYRVNKQYEHIGSIVAQTLKSAVDQKNGTDIRSIAIVRPMIARSLA
jgi:phosphotransacetylase